MNAPVRNIHIIPAGDIPYEVRMKYILRAYRKDKERLEQLQRYAEGLEEENVALQKQLEQKRLDKETSTKRKKKIFELTHLTQAQKVYIGSLQLLLAEHGIPFHDMKTLITITK
jgi:hypothetical protein